MCMFVYACMCVCVHLDGDYVYVFAGKLFEKFHKCTWSFYVVSL